MQRTHKDISSNLKSNTRSWSGPNAPRPSRLYCCSSHWWTSTKYYTIVSDVAKLEPLHRESVNQSVLPVLECIGPLWCCVFVLKLPRSCGMYRFILNYIKEWDSYNTDFYCSSTVSGILNVKWTPIPGNLNYINNVCMLCRLHLLMARLKGST